MEAKAEGDTGRRHTTQARQKIVCELEAGGRLRSRQKAHTTQAEGTPTGKAKGATRCTHSMTHSSPQARNRPERTQAHTAKQPHTGHSTHNLLMNRSDTSRSGVYTIASYTGTTCG